MAKNQSTPENETTEQQAELEEKISSYEKLLDRLKKERRHVEDELSKDYRNARRYVRSHPEEGILMSFVGGVALGIIIGKLTK
ncbi:hypothetical protein NC796_07345 [Aliifodinibius sp. S!AR15-10]|uniref:hypothetical protein n=1 Tax=Aliifodinibius sp. S!AR15-10 TaxID=2950437 RepID=UPI002860F072|nr:hypothetical protein [Aliifodinibius sp. S!AR15-10]MDR8390946.1 hypothetical protein [Aliifodinibius sp. S!AR15-10]